MLLGTHSGCKVGWHYWSTEEEAKADAAKQAAERGRKSRQGYDFGYQWPGSTPEKINHREHGECWVVVTV